MANAPPAHILLVEGDGDLLEVLKYVLEDDGFQISAAANGADALKLAKANPIDLVVLDVGMSGMEGIDVARALRADAETSGVALAVHTGLSQDVVRAEFDDFDVYLPAVDDANVLLGLINDFLGTRLPPNSASENSGLAISKAG